VLTDPDAVAERVLRLVSDGTVETVSGELLALRPESICLHGDTPGAVTMARAVRTALTAAGVELMAFA
jgi:UPF0271 protein